MKHNAAFRLSGAVVLCLLAACNTVAGAGKDIKSAGSEITKTADDVKK